MQVTTNIWTKSHTMSSTAYSYILIQYEVTLCRKLEKATCRWYKLLSRYANSQLYLRLGSRLGMYLELLWIYQSGSQLKAVCFPVWQIFPISVTGAADQRHCNGIPVCWWYRYVARLCVALITELAWVHTQTSWPLRWSGRERNSRALFRYSLPIEPYLISLLAISAQNSHYC